MNFPCLALTILLATAVGAWDSSCISQPVGFAFGTTGGDGGEVVYPKTNDELKKALCGEVDKSTKGCKDDTKRTIVLTDTFSFEENVITVNGSWYNNCFNGAQVCYNAFAGACDGATDNTVEFSLNQAGRSPLLVGSNKSIVGKDGKGVLLGKGLVIRKATNVIVRDITIQDINPQVVWGGDALTFEDSSNVWIHKVTFRNIGRMMVVAGGNTNRGVTISSCVFDGNTEYSAYCDGTHYWNVKFYSLYNEVTLVNNLFEMTSGRSPDAGGVKTGTTFVHMVGNYFNKNTHHAIEPKEGAHIIAEGNTFVDVKNVWSPGAGQLFLADNSTDANRCRKYLGYTCSVNSYSGSSVTPKTDKTALKEFSKFNSKILTSTVNTRCAWSLPDFPELPACLPA